MAIGQPDMPIFLFTMTQVREFHDAKLAAGARLPSRLIFADEADDVASSSHRS